MATAFVPTASFSRTFSQQDLQYDRYWPVSEIPRLQSQTL
ncbi:hypothetical protein GGP93_002946 [Salinibacter ruber]|nr:hypothetical protein [Salinibacter ruber]